LAPGRRNPSSQAELIEQYLIFAGSNQVRREAPANSGEAQLSTRQLEELQYESASKFKEQGKQLLSQRSDIEILKNLIAQLQQNTSPLPQQLAELSARAGETEIKTGQLAGEINATKQQLEGAEKRLSTRVGEVEGRVSRLASQAANIEDQATALRARTESLEKELDRRAQQVEARTEELGERTVELKRENDRLDQLQRIAIAAILSEIEAEADSLHSKTSSLWYRLFNRGSAKRDLANLRQRANSISESLKHMGPAAGPFLEKLQELNRKLDQIGRRLD
jgi:chromosome segregation ATPase